METEQLLKRIEILEQQVKNLSAFSTIPYDVEKAFRDRLKISTYASLGSSVKTVASETQGVNEGGAASYNVPKIFDGYRQMTDGGNVYYFPYYT